MLNLTVEQLRAIMPKLSKDKAKEYLPYLQASMDEAKIDTVQRVAAYLAQLAHESLELKYFEERGSGANYEGRVDLGNTHTGDGKRFKGRSPIQITGRYNYRKAGAALGVDLENHPELASTLPVAFRIAGWYWTTHKLNVLADQGSFDAISYRVNGGWNGKESRRKYYDMALSVLATSDLTILSGNRAEDKEVLGE